MFSLLTHILLPAGANPEDPDVRAKAGKRCGVLGILANALLFVSKLTIGLMAGSVSIVADAMNNLSDAGSSVVTLVGFRLAQTPADEDHPYGHARYEYLSGLAVAVMILLIGFELGKSSVGKILEPQEVLFSWVTALVLALSVAVKMLLFAANHRVGKALNSGALLAAAQDSRNDCVATVAVLLCGVIGRISGVQGDGWAGLGVAVFIFWSGWNMAKETISPLLGENGSPELQKQIIASLKTSPKILGYHDMMVHDYGPGQRFASVHVEMDLKEDPLACHNIIDDVERYCLEEYRIHLVIHYDPVVVGDPEQDSLRETIYTALQSVDKRLNLHDFRMVRGTHHTNLIFDVALPADLNGKENLIGKTIDSALTDREEKMKYYTVITYDSEAFNRPISQ